MATVVLVGTLDTKGEECAFLATRLRQAGVEVVVVDVGVLGEPRAAADVSAARVAAAGGAELGELRAGGDRGRAIAAMADGARAIVRELHEAGRCDGVLGAGGSGNTAIAAAAMRALPLGVPKLLVSTVAAHDTRAYVGQSDITMMASVVDVAGLNSVLARVLANAAAAMAGMVTAAPVALAGGRPLVGATMFGVTTACVTVARAALERLGYEVLVFHANGAGGRALEALAASGQLAGVLDVTTTELADELVGGELSAGPDRLEAAGRAGIPQAISLGALDMVNFGAPDAVPARFAGRRLLSHNPHVTLMRTTVDECRALGRIVAEKASAARGPTAIFLPLGGISAVAARGGPFHDAAADAALFAAVRAHVIAPVEVLERDEDVNAPAFAQAMAGWLHERIAA